MNSPYRFFRRLSFPARRYESRRGPDQCDRLMILRYAYLVGLQMRLKRFRHAARRAQAVQHRVLMAKVRRHANSSFGRDFGFSQIRSADDFRRRLPVATYDDHHPYIDRVLHGDVEALFRPARES